jgi:predicted PolB exonuclease-like 3'-5' exonuclease
MEKIKRKRLFFDLESSPNIGFFWKSGFKLNIGTENIIKERAIICICYKWEGEKQVHSLNWDSKQCDKAMLQKFIKVANQAAELVAHNGDRYDLTWIRTRCLYHGIDMFPNYTTIDTLKISRSKFNFNSNKLDYIAKFLGVGQKIKTEFSMWRDIVLDNDKVAMSKMIKYCKMDVIVLERVFKALNAHILPKTNYAMIGSNERGNCPECGSKQIIVRAHRYTAIGGKRIQYQCRDCHKYHNKIESKKD